MRSILLKIDKYEIKCNDNGTPYITSVIRIYYKVQKNNRLSENKKSLILNKLYEIISKRSPDDIKSAARKEMTKKYSDNIYSLFCNYIILTGEL